MKKQHPRVLALLLVLTMVMTLCPLSAMADGNKLIIRVDTATVLIGSSVDINVSLGNNPGISGLQMELEYDDTVLTLNTVTYADSSVTGLTSQASQKLTSPVKLTFYNGTADTTYNGVVATLNFTVKEGIDETETSLSVSASEDSVANILEENVPFEVVNGAIRATNCIPGDINDDRKVNIKDLIRLAQYLADWDVEVVESCLDTNGDGNKNIKDLIRLAQYLADWDVELHITLPCRHINVTEVEAKAPTCVSTGNTAYWVCDRCGKCFSDSNATTEITLESTVTAIDPNNHEHIVVDEAVPATETSTGLTEGKHCSDCLMVIEEQIVVPILDQTHSITYNIAGNDTYLQSITIDNPNENEYTPGQTYILQGLNVDGYSFDGWYTAEGNRITQIPSTAREDYVLTAHWSKIPFTVQFNVSMIDPSQRDLLVIDKYAEGTAKNEYTIDKAWVLPMLTMDTYIFVGWSDQYGNFYANNMIPKGTTGNLVLKDNWASQRNRAVAKTTLDDPLIMEDLDNQIIYFAYEIGTIENVPLYTTQELNCVNGIVTILEKTTTHSISSEDMQKLGTTLTKETTDSTQFELSEELTDVTEVTENYGKSVEEIDELKETQAKSQSSTQSFNTSSGGSSQTYQYNDKTTKNETNENYVLNTNLDSGFSTELTTNFSNKTEVSAGLSFPIDIIDVNLGAKNTTEFSVGTDTKMYVDSSIGTSSTWDNNTYLETNQKNSTTNSSYWNTESGYELAQESSNSTTVSEALHETISASTGYGKTYSKKSGNTSILGSTNAIGTTTDNVTSFTYTEQNIESTTVGLQTTGNTYGNYRMIMAGTLHAFAIVGYDVATQNYFVYTHYVMGDGTSGNDGYHEIMDYSYDRSFSDWESTVIPFTVPNYVMQYVNSRTTYTEGLGYDFNYTNHTATVESYSGSDKVVYVPSYMVDDEGTAFRVTEFTADAFQGKDIKAISLGRFITEIPDSAFKGCTSLERIVCPRVISIGSEAFSGCTNLLPFEIPEAITYLGESAFTGVPTITAIVHKYGENEQLVMTSAEIAENIASSGADSITLNISNVPVADTMNLLTPNGSNLIIDGGGKTFTSLTIESGTTSTKLSRITIDATSNGPVKLNSKNVTLYMVSIENSCGFDILLLNADTNLTLSGTNSIRSDGGKALLCKNVNVNYENSGKLNVTGNIYRAGTVNDTNNRIVFTSANPAYEIIEITEIEFNLYLQGEITISFDVNGGDEMETSSKKAFRQTAVGELPTPTRENYDFDGWFTEGGTAVTADSSFNADTTIFAHWTPKQFTVSWNNSDNVTISASIVESPLAGTEAGPISNGDTVHYGDVINVAYVPNNGYEITNKGVETITVDSNVTSESIFVTAVLTEYHANWTVNAGTEITVTRTASPLANAALTAISSGASVYYGDVLSISYNVDSQYTLKSKGSENITVTGNVGSDTIYVNAEPKSVTYSIQYRSTNGTDLGSSSATYTYGSTNTIYAPEKAGYSTPSSQTVTWDQSSKTITFTYSPISQPTYQTLCTGEWWTENGYGINYSVAIEYRNRTANTVEAHIIWTQSINGACYGQNQYFNGNIGSTSLGDILIVNSGRWYNGTNDYYYTDSASVDSGWVTLSADATTTSVGVSGYWWDAWRTGAWGGTLYIPTY